VPPRWRRRRRDQRQAEQEHAPDAEPAGERARAERRERGGRARDRPQLARRRDRDAEIAGDGRQDGDRGEEGRLRGELRDEEGRGRWEAHAAMLGTRRRGRFGATTQPTPPGRRAPRNDHG
jgi:hypothetical protein